MQVSSVGGASPQLVAVQRKAYAEQAAPVVADADRQAISKAQRAVDRSDVLYL